MHWDLQTGRLHRIYAAAAQISERFLQFARNEFHGFEIRDVGFDLFIETERKVRIRCSRSAGKTAAALCKTEYRGVASRDPRYSLVHSGLAPNCHRS
jgi:hypothetical protein